MIGNDMILDMSELVLNIVKFTKKSWEFQMTGNDMI